MMKATIIKQWRVAPEGHTVVTFEPGDIVKGALAELAISDGSGEALLETKPMQASLEKKPAQRRKTRARKA